MVSGVDFPLVVNPLMEGTQIFDTEWSMRIDQLRTFVQARNLWPSEPREFRAAAEAAVELEAQKWGVADVGWAKNDTHSTTVYDNGVSSSTKIMRTRRIAGSIADDFSAVLAARTCGYYHPNYICRFITRTVPPSGVCSSFCPGVFCKGIWSGQCIDASTLAKDVLGMCTHLSSVQQHSSLTIARGMRQ